MVVRCQRCLSASLALPDLSASALQGSADPHSMPGSGVGGGAWQRQDKQSRHLSPDQPTIQPADQPLCVGREGGETPQKPNLSRAPRGRSHSCGVCTVPHKTVNPRKSPELQFPYTESSVYNNLVVQRDPSPRTTL